MNNLIKTPLFLLFERQQDIWQQKNQSLPLQDFESDWLSACQVGEPEEGKVQWQPIAREADLHNIEDALGIKLHPSISDFFCQAFAGHLPCLFEGHPIELIQAWNEQDFQLLQENMIAHFLMQKRLKKPASMFIASCSDEMQIVSILNETGQVQLENLGKGQEQVLAENLTDFLTHLEPVIKL